MLLKGKQKFYLSSCKIVIFLLPYKSVDDALARNFADYRDSPLEPMLLNLILTLIYNVAE